MSRRRDLHSRWRLMRPLPSLLGYAGAGEEGFAPSSTGSEPAILLLNDSPLEESRGLAPHAQKAPFAFKTMPNTRLVYSPIYAPHSGIDPELPVRQTSVLPLH